jgi:Tol biopolymer transport system component
MVDLVQELDWIAESSGATAAAKPRMKSRWVMAAGSVLVVLAAAVFFITFARRDDRPPRAVTRLAVIPPRGATVTGIAISPDSRRIVLTLTIDGVSSLHLRDLESLESRALPGTTNGSQPFWSPDSSSIGFFADGKLKRIDLNGGAVRSLANAGQPRGGDWGSSGTIVFAPSTEDAIYAVNSDGGPMRPVTTYVRDSAQRSQRFPSMLPDGEHFVYFSMEERRNGICVASVHGGAPRWLTDSDTGAVYSSGNLYFVRQGVFAAQRFDVVKGQLAGMATSLGDRPAWGIPFGTPGFSVARDGTLAYQSGSESKLRWFSRGGKQIGSVGEPSKFISAVSLSADDGRVAVSRFDHGDGDIWLYDLGRSTTTHLVHSPLTEFSPFWSKDGRFILFARTRGRTTEFVRRLATDEGPEEVLATATSVRGLYDWSTDGRFAIYTREGKATNDDVYALPLDGAREPIAIANSEFSESWGRLSPDGRWIAYTSDETGREEVYVQSFPQRGRRWLVSVDGASRPRWRRDGKELMFIARDGSVTAIALNTTRLPFDGATPRRLFDAPGDIGDYDVTADGQRFLMNVRDSDVGRPAVIVLSGWQPGRRV